MDTFMMPALPQLPLFIPSLDHGEKERVSWIPLFSLSLMCKCSLHECVSVGG